MKLDTLSHVLRPHQSLSTRRRADCRALSCVEMSVGIKGEKKGWGGVSGEHRSSPSSGH